MSTRKPIIAANWKMNQTPTESKAFLEKFLPKFPESTPVDIVIAPAFLSMPMAAAQIVPSKSVDLSAQNMSAEPSGAFTGEVSAAMLKEVGTKYVILGHSERRSIFGEDDATINAKVKATLDNGFQPILCIGESLEEREGGKLEEVLRSQINGSLADVTAEQMANVVIAYEPVWAIGTGVTASPEQAQEAHAFVRGLLKDLFNEEVAAATRIQYGGSVKPGNAGELIALEDIDGFLVGGASLDPDSFGEIVQAGIAHVS
ncbi:MAG: triose-phosphate isomerase [Verrucomicrobiales bacterium]|nr:triose-phosphate isomerase [Verrucomicrobiales bacterium]